MLLLPDTFQPDASSSPAFLSEKDEQKSVELLAVKNLSIEFSQQNGNNTSSLAVNNISFSVHKGKSLCLVGESGCGKTLTALSLLRLLPEPSAKIQSGQLLFQGRDLLSLSSSELLHVRGSNIGMIFQDPMASLNPVMRVGKQICEGLIMHKKMSRSDAMDKAIALLQKVGITNASERINDYPHQLSGGMRQRVMIAMSVVCSPSLLIADEPTTSLDVTVQRQILGLITQLVEESNMGLLLISHDIDLVAECADYIAVMYAGKIVEQGTAIDILEQPRHPYTQGLLASRPAIDINDATKSSKQYLKTIPGSPPGLWNRPSGCEFHTRCEQAKSICRKYPPLLHSFNRLAGEHSVSCHFV